jgi:putative ATPase
MEELGIGCEYRYAHDDIEAYSAGEDYFPNNMPAVKLYEPTTRGLEERISEKLAHLRELDKKVKNPRKPG